MLTLHIITSIIAVITGCAGVLKPAAPLAYGSLFMTGLSFLSGLCILLTQPAISLGRLCIAGGITLVISIAARQRYLAYERQLI